MVQVHFLGCGDAFGSGGRFQTCIRVAGQTTSALIDCGPSALIAMRKFGVDPNSIDAVFLTHLHGDHFGGLPFLILDAHLASKRQTPLTIVGPPGLTERLDRAREALFHGSTGTELRYPLRVVEVSPGKPTTFKGMGFESFAMVHPSGAPSTAVRLTVDEKTVAYTGDTQWNERVPLAAQDADLFIAECYTFAASAKYHLSHQALMDHAHTLTAKRMILTHMGREMLDRRADANWETAKDGLLIDL